MNDVSEIVVALLEDTAGKILLQRRGRDALLGGTWELPGGKLELNEDHTTALAREVREETGLEVRVGALVCALCHDYGDRRVALHAYRCEVVAGGAGAPSPPENARWVTLDECRALAIPAANPPLLDAFAWVRVRG